MAGVRGTPATVSWPVLVLDDDRAVRRGELDRDDLLEGYDEVADRTLEIIFDLDCDLYFLVFVVGNLDRTVVLDHCGVGLDSLDARLDQLALSAAGEVIYR